MTPNCEGFTVANWLNFYRKKNTHVCFFREQAVEYMKCEKAVYSRVTGKSDRGDPNKYKHSCTTYLKTDDLITRFFRMAAQMCVYLC